MTGQHQHDDFDWAAYGESMIAWDVIEETCYRAIVDWLGVADGQVVIDVGSGAGGMTSVFVEAVGPTGTVVAIDGEPALLDIARRRASRADHHLLTAVADLEHQSLEDVSPVQPVDLVHASAVVHHLDDELAAIARLCGVVRPGGRLVVVEGGLGTRFLPPDCGIGEPGLELRIAAATEAWFWSEVRPAGKTVRSGRGWGEMLADAGLVDVVARSFLLDVPPPLDDRARRVVREWFSHQLERVGDRLDVADRAAVERLADADDPNGVMHRPDVFVLLARTVHVGTVAD